MSTVTEYRELLAEFMPRPIRSEKDHERALAQLERIMTPHPNAARSMLIEMLSTLIEDYESREHPTPRLSPSRILAHLLDAKGLPCAEVAKRTGIPQSTLINVLADRRGISKASAVKLATFFSVSPAIFLSQARMPG